MQHPPYFFHKYLFAIRVVWRILGITFHFHSEVHIWATMSVPLPWSTCSCSARNILSLRSIVSPIRAPTDIDCEIDIHMIPTIHCKYNRKEKDWHGFRSREASTTLFTDVGSGTLQTMDYKRWSKWDTKHYNTTNLKFPYSLHHEP